MNDSTVTLLFFLWFVMSWMTHVVNCIINHEWVFLLAGALFFPIGCIHGTGIWLGVW